MTARSAAFRCGRISPAFRRPYRVIGQPTGRSPAGDLSDEAFDRFQPAVAHMADQHLAPAVFAALYLADSIHGNATIGPAEAVCSPCGLAVECILNTVDNGRH